MPTLEERFWARVQKCGHGQMCKRCCWEWQGSTHARGYGKINIDGRWFPAHRVAWVLSYGTIGESLVIDHLCRQRSCVNPSHLELVTNAINILRGKGITAMYASRTHCKHGHPFNESNTRIDPTRGDRRCRQCERLRAYAYKKKGLPHADA